MQANRLASNKARQNSIIQDTERNYHIIEDNILDIKKIGECLKDNVTELNSSYVEIIESVHMISGILEETMANTKQTENVSNQNLDIVRTMKVLSKELYVWYH